MRKTKLLITAMSMNIGGAEKSLINLLNLLDYDEFDIDLLLFQRRGEFLPQIPARVNVISVPEIDVLYGVDPQGEIVPTKKISLKVSRYFATGVTRLLEKQFDRRRLARWEKFYSARIPKLKGGYDCAVSYSGGETFWYVVEKVDAARKVTYYHSDYSNIDIDADAECKYLESADSIVTISNKCAESLIDIFPSQESKVAVVQNPTSPSLIRKMGEEYVDDSFKSAKDCLKIVSIGRLHPIKGFDLAVNAASMLVESGRTAFEWIVVGDGVQKDAISKTIAEKNLEHHFKLVGKKANPYPYLMDADLLVQPSRFEGKSVVLDEARIIGVPTLVTRYPSAVDQVDDGLNGILVDIDAKSIATGIRRLLEERNLLERLQEGARATIPAGLEDVLDFKKIVMG